MRDPLQNCRHWNVGRLCDDLVASPNKDCSVRSSNPFNDLSDFMAQQWSQPKQLSYCLAVLSHRPTVGISAHFLHGNGWIEWKRGALMKCLEVPIPSAIVPFCTVYIQPNSRALAVQVHRTQTEEHREKPTVHCETETEPVHCILRRWFVKT